MWRKVKGPHIILPDPTLKAWDFGGSVDHIAITAPLIRIETIHIKIRTYTSQIFLVKPAKETITIKIILTIFIDKDSSSPEKKLPAVHNATREKNNGILLKKFSFVSITGFGGDYKCCQVKQEWCDQQCQVIKIAQTG